MKIEFELKSKEVAGIVEKHILEEFPQILGADLNRRTRDIYISES